jgi:hypothetical protein
MARRKHTARQTGWKWLASKLSQYTWAWGPLVQEFEDHLETNSAYPRHMEDCTCPIIDARISHNGIQNEVGLLLDYESCMK